METVRVVLFINRMPDGALTGCTSNMANIGWPLIKKTVMEIEVEAIDEMSAQIETLKENAESIMSEARKQAGEIQAQIQSIKENYSNG